MPNFGPSDGTKRKPSTYGKPSRRALQGFQSENTRDDHTLREGSVTRVKENIVGQIRKSLSEAKRATEERNLSPTSSSTSVEAPSKVTLKGNALDLYDVPSSDEDRPAVRTRPLPKKRKIQARIHEHDDMVVTRPISPPLGASKPVKNKPSITGTDQKHTQRGMSLGRTGRHNTFQGREANMCRVASTKTSEQSSRSATARGNQGRAPHVSTSLSTTTNHPLEKVLHDARVACHQTSQECDTNIVSARDQSPRTPPEVEPIPDVTSQATTHYLSPSGLDIPGLLIDGIETTIPEQSPRLGKAMHGSMTTAYQRSPYVKLKDRLTTEDGSSRYDSAPADFEETSDGSISGEDGIKSLNSEHSDTYQVDPAPEKMLLSNPTPAAVPQRHQHFVTAGPKITYIARERSLRKDDNEDDMLMDMPLENENQASKVSRRLDANPVASHVSTIHDNDDMDDEDLMGNGSMRSIHELRQAGGNARVFGEAEAVLDDIASSSLSLRRSGLLDLCAKLNKANFRAHFSGHGLAARLCASANPKHDVLTKTLFSVVLLNIVAHDNAPQTLAVLRRPLVLDTLLVLAHENVVLSKVAKERSLNVTKAIQTDVQKLVRILSSSEVWKCGKPTLITSRCVALQCLEYIVRHTREGASTEEVLSQAFTDSLLQMLSSMTTGQDLDRSVSQEVEVRLILSTLESSTLNLHSSVVQSGGFWSKTSLLLIAKLLKDIRSCSFSSEGRVWSLSLRFCLNLTSANGLACDVLAAGGIIEHVLPLVDAGFRASKDKDKTSEEEQAIKVDNTVLSLALLINLAERGPENRLCLLTQGALSVAPLDTLLGIFTDKWQAAFEVSILSGTIHQRESF
jgi:hypothetical protein